MIHCIFTLDYEIFGNGTGSLMELVFDPAEQLRDIFRRWNARLVVFVEVAELEKIEAFGSDPAIGLVKRQIQDLHRDGHEIGLHLHPQWCNAHYEQGRWFLDESEYNLCTLSAARISQIVERSLVYLRHALNRSGFAPLSFRAGNWLFQPTEHAAPALAQRGIRIDSSVFKGGLQHGRNLDYRPALCNGYYWPFKGDVNKPDPTGPWIEMPIYTEMVPFWRVATPKRLGFGHGLATSGRSVRQELHRARDLLRFRYPLKLDFCRMTLDEMTSMVARVIEEDGEEPDVHRPLVAIGHTKDLWDSQAIDSFLCFLHAKDISVSTFEMVYPKLSEENGRPG